LEYLSTWTAKKMGREALKLVCCHLGGSGSLCAVKNGISIDTTMGMSLQCGVLQNNRIGDMDPYVIFYLVEECGMTLSEVKTMLQTKSGLFGLSGGVSNDLRDIQEAADAGNEDCLNAVKAYSYGIKKYIGAYTAAMGGLDAIVFGGGIGRNSAEVRARSLEGLECFGVELDEEKNRNAKGGMDLSNGVKLFTEVNNYLADIDVKTEHLRFSQDMFVAEMAHFVDCILGRTELIAKAEDGIQVMKILDAIYESARTGHEVIL
jgi:acetate kinase